MLTDHLFAAVRGVLESQSDLSAAIRRIDPGRGARRWLELESNDRFDAWPIAWGIDSQLAAHDHGGSDGAVHVLRGGLVEWYRDRGDRAAWTVRELVPGRSVAIPATRVHEIHQAGPEAAVSLHVYSPPLRALRAYSPVHTLGAAAARHDFAERRIA